MAKLLRFALFSTALLSIAQQGSAQQWVYSLYGTPPTEAGAKNGTNWRKAFDSTLCQIDISSVATSTAANSRDGMVWSEITSSG